jgi:ABC-type Mn2+/Zn2+ transport system permease subunit
MKITIVLSVAFAMISAAVGYYLSWIEQLPTGATMVVTASFFLIPGFLKILRRNTV